MARSCGEKHFVYMKIPDVCTVCVCACVVIFILSASFIITMQKIMICVRESTGGVEKHLIMISLFESETHKIKGISLSSFFSFFQVCICAV